MKSVLLLSHGLMASAKDTAGAGGETKAEDKPKLVKVKVLCPALGEDAESYVKGDTFETTAQRAAALGDLVQVI
jgi:hypothetical protein